MYVVSEMSLNRLSDLQSITDTCATGTRQRLRGGSGGPSRRRRGLRHPQARAATGANDVTLRVPVRSRT